MKVYTVEKYLAAYPEELLQHPDKEGFSKRSFENLYDEALEVKSGMYDDLWTNPYRAALVNWSFDYSKWYESKKRHEEKSIIRSKV